MLLESADIDDPYNRLVYNRVCGIVHNRIKKLSSVYFNPLGLVQYGTLAFIVPKNSFPSSTQSYDHPYIIELQARLKFDPTPRQVENEIRSQEFDTSVIVKVVSESGDIKILCAISSLEPTPQNSGGQSFEFTTGWRTLYHTLYASDNMHLFEFNRIGSFNKYFTYLITQVISIDISAAMEKKSEEPTPDGKWPSTSQNWNKIMHQKMKDLSKQGIKYIGMQ